MEELNEYAGTNSWYKWFTLHLTGGAINNLTKDSFIVAQKYFP